MDKTDLSMSYFMKKFYTILYKEFNITNITTTTTTDLIPISITRNEDVNTIKNMRIIYRISETHGINKIKHDQINKRDYLIHFLKIFCGYDIHIICDNITDKMYNWICSLIPDTNISRTSLNNSRSFIFAVNYAITNFDKNDRIYFAEDDYIYKTNAPLIINEGLDIADYSSGYDHPDKYINHCDGGPNPFIENGGELTRLLLTKNSHWKYTNSCCMTFATTISQLIVDYDIFIKHCQTNIPNDFNIWTELINNSQRKLVSCIPGISTHGELKWLSPLVEWTV
jgi:hypothetical protein